MEGHILFIFVLSKVKVLLTEDGVKRNICLVTWCSNTTFQIQPMFISVIIDSYYY